MALDIMGKLFCKDSIEEIENKLSKYCNFLLQEKAYAILGESCEMRRLDAAKYILKKYHLGTLPTAGFLKIARRIIYIYRFFWQYVCQDIDREHLGYFAVHSFNKNK